MSVSTKAATPWVPAGHLVVRRTLSDQHFLSELQDKFPQKPNLSEFRTISTFVSVKEVNSSSATAAGAGQKEGGKGEKTSSVTSKDKAKPSFSEPHMLVTWSDGSYATVGTACGRLTRYCNAL